MRDFRKTPDYWSAHIEDSAAFKAKLRRDLVDAENCFKGKRNTASFLNRNECNLCSAMYWSGYPVPDCARQVRKLLLSAYPVFVAVCRMGTASDQASEDGGTDFKTRYLALAVLARLTAKEAAPLVDALDFWSDRDAVWERFIVHLGLGRGRAPAPSLLWPDAYQPLLEALDPASDAAARQAALLEFDKNWLKKMRKSTIPRYSNHTNEKHRTYVGYWNFEAAAAAVIMNIDDAGLASHRPIRRTGPTGRGRKCKRLVPLPARLLSCSGAGCAAKTALCNLAALKRNRKVRARKPCS